MIVSAACPAARQLGLAPGMKLTQAQAMILDLAVVPARTEADQAALVALAGWCLRYTPLTRAAPPDGVWLDLTGCAHLLGGEDALLAELGGRMRRQGLCARIAIAPTPGAAYAVARHGAPGLASVTQERLEATLAPLPVAALRLGPEQVALLHRFGLETIAAFAALPRGPLTRRLGAGAMRRLDQALGRVAEPVGPVLPPTRLQERLVFAEPLQTADSLAAANALLTARLCRRLEEACLGARRLELVFVRLGGSFCVQSVALARPSHTARTISRLLDERLERVDPGEGIETVWLVAQWAEPVAPEQAAWREHAPMGARHTATPLDELRDLAPLIDTLRNRLGTGRLWRPVPVESDVPERSLRKAPFEDTASLAQPAGWPTHLPRPLRLLEPPQKVAALAGLPDHAPAAFTWRRRRHLVKRSDGPERIAGEWWLRSGEMAAIRDYFRVEDEDGRRFWLFRRGDGTNPATGDLGWFLHGLF